MSEIPDKINGENAQDDELNFMLCEMRFMMKGFRATQDDRQALLIAKQINAYLAKDGKVRDVKDTLEELEEYSDSSTNEYFLWELVYIRRRISEMEDDEDYGLFFAAENRALAAKRFERICEAAPTYFNGLCRIREYVTAAKYFLRVKYSDEATRNAEKQLARAKELFLQTEERDNGMYYETAQYLYMNEYIGFYVGQKRLDECYDLLSKAIYFSRKMYDYDKEPSTLRLIAVYYLDYMKCSRFCFRDEEENIEILIRRLKTHVLSGNETLEKWLDKLVDAVERFRNS